MTEKENIIKALGEIAAYFRSSFESMAGGTLACETFRWYAEAAGCALALLKAQEPRVMTLDEALGGEECWVEYPSGGCGYADCYLSYTAKGADIYRTMQRDFNVPIANYGKTWRCWTSLPTDEQREAEPWRS